MNSVSPSLLFIFGFISHSHLFSAIRLTLPEEPPSAPPQTVIASGRTNQSIMIQWQPPPESHQNGLLQGYIIRWDFTFSLFLSLSYTHRHMLTPPPTTPPQLRLIFKSCTESQAAVPAGRGMRSSKFSTVELRLPLLIRDRLNSMRWKLNLNAVRANVTTVIFTTYINLT